MNKAAVLVLTREGISSGVEVLLIERAATTKTHQSQVAFPGGGVESQDEGDPIRTALRECEEEVGIPMHAVTVIKTLSSVPTLTGGFFVVPVLGRLQNSTVDGNSLKLDGTEVAHAEWVPVDRLLATRKTEFGFPVFTWVGVDQKTRKVWGLTAIIFDRIFHPAG